MPFYAEDGMNFKPFFLAVVSYPKDFVNEEEQAKKDETSDEL